MPKGIYARRQSTVRKVRATSQDRAQAAPSSPGDGHPSAVTDTPVSLSKRLTTLIEGVRSAFMEYVEDVNVFESSRAALAPKFMKAFEAWKIETGASSFINFVRVLDPSLPMKSRGPDGYLEHTSYRSADYLRRLQAQAERAELSPTEAAARIANAPVNPRRAMARVIASMLTLIDASALPTLWKAMESELHWTLASITSFQELVAEADPLVKVRAPRGVNVAHQLRLTTVHAVDNAEEPATATARTA